MESINNRIRRIDNAHLAKMEFSIYLDYWKDERKRILYFE